MNLNHFVSYEYIDTIAKDTIESHNLVYQVYIEISKGKSSLHFLFCLHFW